MPESTCPHYTAHITGDTGVCQGCGAIVANPSSAAAIQSGLVTGNLKPTHLSSPGRPFEGIARPERPRRK